MICRIPVATAWAWREYGEHWVALDAPRHLFLHTEDSMRRLAVASGFRIERVVYDSTSFQFWGSEQYRLGIPLMDPRSHHVDPKRSPFGKAQIAEWERRAEELNRRGPEGRRVSRSGAAPSTASISSSLRIGFEM